MSNSTSSNYPKTVQDGPFGQIDLQNRQQERVYKVFKSLFGKEQGNGGNALSPDEVLRFLQTRLVWRDLVHRRVYRYYDFYALLYDFLVFRGIKCDKVEEAGSPQYLPLMICEIWNGDDYKVEREQALSKYNHFRTTSTTSTASSINDAEDRHDVLTSVPPATVGPGPTQTPHPSLSGRDMDQDRVLDAPQDARFASAKQPPRRQQAFTTQDHHVSHPPNPAMRPSDPVPNISTEHDPAFGNLPQKFRNEIETFMHEYLSTRLRDINGNSPSLPPQSGFPPRHQQFARSPPITTGENVPQFDRINRAQRMHLPPINYDAAPGPLPRPFDPPHPNMKAPNRHDHPRSASTSTDPKMIISALTSFYKANDRTFSGSDTDDWLMFKRRFIDIANVLNIPPDARITYLRYGLVQQAEHFFYGHIDRKISNWGKCMELFEDKFNSSVRQAHMLQKLRKLRFSDFKKQGATDGQTLRY